MTDNNDTREDEQPDGEQAPQDRTDWKAEARKWEQRAKENRDAAARLAQLEDAGKSEMEKLTARLTEAEQRAAAAEAARARMDAALKVAPDGMPLSKVVSLADRLRGDDADALAADAETLFAEFAPPPAEDAGARTPSGDPTPTPRPRLTPGPNQSSEPLGQDDALVAALTAKLSGR